MKVLQQLQRRAKMINLTSGPVPDIEMKLPLLIYCEGEQQVRSNKLAWRC